MTRRIFVTSLTVVGVLVAVGSTRLGRARAGGIPTTNPLVYTGSLFSNGQPMTGTHTVVVTMQASVDGGAPIAACTPTTQSLNVSNGGFSVSLDSSCVTAVQSNPNLSVDVTVDGTDLGSAPISSVPYAVTSGTASGYAPGSPIANLVPPGTVISFAGAVGGANAAPAGWLLCDGSAVSRASYANLFQAIGTSAGAGDGATTFNLPDYRGRFLRGQDQGTGNDPDAASRTALNPGGNSADAVGSLEANQVQGHSHAVNDPGHAHGAQGGEFVCGSAASSNGSSSPPLTGLMSGSEYFTPYVNEYAGTASASTGITIANSTGSETRPTNVSVNYLIKY